MGAASSLGYNGEYYDADLGLVYLRARWYDPTTGRFLNRDSDQGKIEDPQSIHAYHFGHLDPVNNSDPSGRFSLTELLVTASADGIRAANTINKSAKVLAGGTGALAALQVVINITASINSAIDAEESGSYTKNIRGWGLYVVALLRSLSHQTKMVKAMVKDIKNGVSVRDGVRLLKATGLITQRKSAETSSKKTGAELKKYNGWPEFTPISTTSTFIKNPNANAIKVKGGLTGKRSEDDTLAKKVLFGKGPGTWHHHEVLGVMQLINNTLHDTKHAGGAFFYSMVVGEKYK